MLFKGVGHLLDFGFEVLDFLGVVFAGRGLDFPKPGNFELEGQDFVLVVLDVIAHFLNRLLLLVLDLFYPLTQSLFFLFQLIVCVVEVFVLPLYFLALFGENYVFCLFSLLVPDGLVELGVCPSELLGNSFELFTQFVDRLLEVVPFPLELFEPFRQLLHLSYFHTVFCRLVSFLLER